MVKKPIMVGETTHHQLDKLRADRKLRTFEQTIQYLLKFHQSYKDKSI